MGLTIGQPTLDPQGRPVKDLQGRPVIYHGPLVSTARDAQQRTVWTYADGTKIYAQPTDAQGRILPAPDSGGVWRENPSWNANTGAYDQGPLDWGNILGLVTAGVITGGAASGLVGGGGAAAGAGGSASGPLAGGYGAATTTAAAPAGIAAGTGGAGMAVPWGSIISGGVNLFGNLFGAHEQASAAADAAKIEADAQERIAAQNAKAAADALAFSKSSAENSFQNNEVSRAGNYDQWAAAQRRIGSVAKLLGFGDREIPAYRPGVDPQYDGGGASGSSTPSGPLPTISAGGGDLASQLDAYFKSRGVDTHETPGWVNYWNEWGSKDPAYFNQRLAAADVFRTSAAPPAATPNPYALSRYL